MLVEGLKRQNNKGAIARRMGVAVAIDYLQFQWHHEMSDAMPDNSRIFSHENNCMICSCCV